MRFLLPRSDPPSSAAKEITCKVLQDYEFRSETYKAITQVSVTPIHIVL